MTKGAPTAAEVEVESDSGYVMIHTAAVAGRSRGALIPHLGLIAASAQLIHHLNLGTKDVQLGLLPLFHITGRRCRSSFRELDPHPGGAGGYQRRMAHVTPNYNAVAKMRGVTRRLPYQSGKRQASLIHAREATRFP